MSTYAIGLPREVVALVVETVAQAASADLNTDESTALDRRVAVQQNKLSASREGVPRGKIEAKVVRREDSSTPTKLPSRL